MRNIFFTSDTHFWDADVIGDDKRTFSSTEDMNARIVDGWNSVVRPGDLVYHLGDLTFAYGYRLERILWRLRGAIVLVVGNHDKIGLLMNLGHCFHDVRLWKLFHRRDYGVEFLASHVPQKRDAFPGRAKFNVHGHLHGDLVMRDQSIDHRYINVCVDRRDFTPISIDQIRQEANAVS